MVEGIDDKLFLQYFLAKESIFDTVVETAEIIKNEPGDPTAKSNKAKVIETIRHIFSRGKIAKGLVDSEWERYNFDDINSFEISHPLDQQILFTAGHSVENYLFHHKELVKFSILHFTQDQSVIDIMLNNLPNLTQIAYLLSGIYAKLGHPIKPLIHSITENSWQLSHGKLEFLYGDVFIKYADCTHCSIQDLERYIIDTTSALNSSQTDNLAFLSHGHIYVRVVASALRFSLIHFGVRVNQPVCDSAFFQAGTETYHQRGPELDRFPRQLIDAS
jgi:hypothetical protein